MISFSIRMLASVIMLTSCTLFTSALANSKPERIVSISPSLTEILFSIGAGSQVIAVDSYSNYPPEAPITSLSALEPNMEAIAAFNPDLVVLSYDVGDLVKGLNKIGIETMLLPAATDFEDILMQVKNLGKRTGNIEQADGLAAEMKSDMTNLIYTMQSKRSLRIYHEIDENFYSSSSSSFIGSIYQLLNFTNIADQADKDGYGYPKLSPEYILSSNPSIIVLPGKDPDYLNKLKSRPGWSAIDAVKEDRFLILDEDIGSRWGPRIIDFAKAIVKRVDWD